MKKSRLQRHARINPGTKGLKRTGFKRAEHPRSRGSVGDSHPDGPTTGRQGPVKQRKPAKSGASAAEKRGRDLVYRRSGGWCEIQADEVCTGRGTDWCHRRARSQGGTWSPQNGLHGCHGCHMWTHAHPSTARVNGWACKSYDPIDTGVLRRGVWVVLDEEGGFELCPRKVA